MQDDTQNNDLIFRTNGVERFRIGTVAPKTKLEITKMDEIDPSLILKDKDCIYYRGVKYQKVEKPKPETLYDIIADWWEDVFSTHSDWDMETSIDDLVTRIEEWWLPKEIGRASCRERV